MGPVIGTMAILATSFALGSGVLDNLLGKSKPSKDSQENYSGIDSAMMLAMMQMAQAQNIEPAQRAGLEDLRQTADAAMAPMRQKEKEIRQNIEETSRHQNHLTEQLYGCREFEATASEYMAEFESFLQTPE